jgi:hypothetical protein
VILCHLKLTVLVDDNIPNLEHQITNKSQISTSNDQNIHNGSSVEDLIEHNPNDSFVWSVEFGSRAAQALPHRQALARSVRRVLGFIWGLVFGAWNFFS